MRIVFSTQEISDTGHCVRFFTSHMAVLSICG